MLTREEAAEIVQPEIDAWNRQAEKDHQSLKIYGLLPENASDDLPELQRVQIWKTIEVPCGWCFMYNTTGAIRDYEAGEEYSNFALIGNAHALVNHWTRQIDFLEHAGLPNMEAQIRHYISGLPIEQRIASEERFHLLPYEPVRFFPPTIGVASFREREDWTVPRSISFAVEFDEAYFASRGAKLPDIVIPAQWIEQLRAVHSRKSYTTVIVDLICEEESKHEGIIRRQYRCVLDAEKIRQTGTVMEIMEADSPLFSHFGTSTGAYYYVLMGDDGQSREESLRASQRKWNAELCEMGIDPDANRQG